jgi:ABC-type multidrug transport system ATPase subunit
VAVAVEVEGLRKEYRSGRGQRVVALDGLDLTVPSGGVFGFLGPNGSGKTTTIRCLLGLARPTAGCCRVLGSTEYPRVQARVGSMVEGQALFPGFTGRQNLLLLAQLGGVPPGSVDAVLARVGLPDRADDLLRTYSLGMRQRLGLAAALLKDPELLILDEPANGLDPAGIRDIRLLLRQLGHEGRTVFVSSHLLGEVQQLCDRVAVIAGGRCVASGAVDEVLASAGSTGVMVRVDDVAAGLAALTGAGLAASADGDTIHVEIASGDAPVVAEVLGRHGLWPRELRPGGVGLEEAFLALTDESGAP